MRKSKGPGIGFKMAAEMAVSRDSFAQVLQDLYVAELNVSISSFWDKGWTVKVGDDTNGWVSLVHFDDEDFDDIVACLRNELERRTNT